MNASPKAYRPRALGDNQKRWMERQGWIDRRKVGAHICLPLYDNGTKCWCGAKVKS